MTEYPQSEIEDARYEIWLETGGPAKAEAKHHDLANAARGALLDDGWVILTNQVVKGFEFLVTEMVIRRGDDLRIVVWHPSNREWFTSNGPGLGSSPLRLVLKDADQEQSARRAANRLLARYYTSDQLIELS